MKSKWQKVFSIALATLSVGSAIAMAGCKDAGGYKGDPVTGYDPNGKPASNGGFAVEKGNYVYFINGVEEYTADNTYGDVVKGALMRISKSDLASGKYDKAITIVPSLLVSQSTSGGVFIFGNYVYYATPTTDKNIKTGEVENSWLDFKRATLDGTAAPEEYMFRISDNTADYRFVEENESVYCLYEEEKEENGTTIKFLQSYSVEDEESRTLVKGVDTFFYDTADTTNANVYYTMGVTTDPENEDKKWTAKYNQLYCVNAAAEVEKVEVTKDEASYTVKGGKTYTFDAKAMKEKNAELKKDGDDELYDLDDYATYPYVNLGDLVLDGIGSINFDEPSQFNEVQSTTKTPLTLEGYIYSLTTYADHSLYFTRMLAGGNTTSADESGELYYLSDASKNANDWKAVEGNDQLKVIAPDGAALKDAIFTVENNQNIYYYLENDVLYKGIVETDGSVTSIEMNRLNMTGATLWKKEGDYLYYLQAWTEGEGNGYKLSRINVTGTKHQYNNAGALQGEGYEEYQPVTFAGLEINSSWYLPEIFGNTLLYANEQAFGDTSYNYIYAAKIGADQKAQKEINEKYEEVKEFISEYEDVDLQAALTYFFRTGETKLFEEKVELDLYTEEQQKEFNDFVKAVKTEKKYLAESAFFAQVSKMTDSDKEAIARAWEDSLLQEEDAEEEEKDFPVWAIVLISVGGALIVAGGVTWLLLSLKKKRLEQAKIDATVNAYKRSQIDTTDDKTIDVYADENAENSAEESVEEAPVEAEEQPVAAEETEEQSGEDSKEE